MNGPISVGRAGGGGAGVDQAQAEGVGRVGQRGHRVAVPASAGHEVAYDLTLDVLGVEADRPDRTSRAGALLGQHPHPEHLVAQTRRSAATSPGSRWSAGRAPTRRRRGRAGPPRAVAASGQSRRPAPAPSRSPAPGSRAPGRSPRTTPHRPLNTTHLRECATTGRRRQGRHVERRVEHPRVAVEGRHRRRRRHRAVGRQSRSRPGRPAASGRPRGRRDQSVRRVRSAVARLLRATASPGSDISGRLPSAGPAPPGVLISDGGSRRSTGGDAIRPAELPVRRPVTALWFPWRRRCDWTRGQGWTRCRCRRPARPQTSRWSAPVCDSASSAR